MMVVGAPLRFRNRVYNTAAVIHRGVVLGVVPKSYLPTYREFYERRWYAPGDDQIGQDIRVAHLEAPFGPDLLFEALDVPGLTVHAEICEDLWTPIPPSTASTIHLASPVFTEAAPSEVTPPIINSTSQPTLRCACSQVSRRTPGRKSARAPASATRATSSSRTQVLATVSESSCSGCWPSGARVRKKRVSNRRDSPTGVTQ